MSQKVIIYPGTFDPLTYGHIDIIERGANLGDQLIVAVSLNSGKQPLFTMEERTTHNSGSASNSGVDRLLDHLLENLKTGTICYPAAGDIRLSHFYGSACLMTRFATVEPLCQISPRCQGRDAKQ